MTKQEAKEKWCPLAQISYQFYAGVGRSEFQRCCGSECMMWRWSIVGATVNGVYDDNYPVEGYCGLGGKP